MAEVRVIREGWWRWIERGRSADASCTTTLIEAGGRRILVDVPNAGEERELLEALAAAGLKPEDIDLVAVTHLHPDHVGCLSLFPRAEFVGAHTRWRGSKHVHWAEAEMALAEGVRVVKTRGHSEQDCAVLAQTNDGIVAMVGDLWVRSPADPRILVVADRAKLEESRRTVAAAAKWIVPGHGPMAPSSEAKW